jgi:ribonucleoside-diphosphate reductase alpha chain
MPSKIAMVAAEKIITAGDNLTGWADIIDAAIAEARKPYHLPPERPSITRKLKVSSVDPVTEKMETLKCYVTVGLREDGSPGEVFFLLKKTGSLERGLMHALALVCTLALKYGVPMEEISAKLTGLHFEPKGFTGDKEIKSVNSIVDYIGKWLALHFCKRDEVTLRIISHEE